MQANGRGSPARRRGGRFAVAALATISMTTVAYGLAPTAPAAAAASTLVVVNNTGTSTINGWTVTFTFPGDQKITNSWNATVTQNGVAVSATAMSYNSAIPPGGNTSFGFQGTWNTNDNAPASFSVNGSPCS